MSAGEIRRLVWQVVAAVERGTEQVFQWSWWRRWHQAWAAWYHARRRAARLPAPEVVAAPAPAPTAAAPAPPAERPVVAASEVVAQVWARLLPLLVPPRQARRTWLPDRRRILEAIVYVMQTDCGWSALPSRFPPAKTVQTQYAAWRKAGIWSQVWDGLAPPGPCLLE